MPNTSHHYCQMCQVVPPRWGKLCRLCTVSTAVVNTIDAVAAAVVYAVLFTLANIV